jgi:Flp pilus assembly protein TadG
MLSDHAGAAPAPTSRKNRAAASRLPSMQSSRLSLTGGDAGFSALEMVIIFPLTLFMIFGIIQFGIWYHANDVARAAAQEAVRSAGAYQATQSDGAQAASLVLSQNAKGLIIHTRVACSRGAAVATATVTGDALQVIPFIPLPVKATATSPVEAFLPPPRA